ncbi:MAG: DUF917 domain-containing protein, partial [Variibacter sp.]|nr:DUF917 domain-containing protein [Variibacter sp.]
LTTQDDLADFIRGLTLLGTGGGGRPEAGYAALAPLIAKGERPKWRPLHGIDDGALFCSLSGLGSIAPIPPMGEAERAEAGYPAQMDDTPPMLRALRALERHVGKTIAGVFPIELGASNSTTPLAAAVAAGIDMIDCDCAGRAIPEMSQSSVARAGIPFAPAAFADHWGTVLTVSHCHSAKLGERLGKAISTVTKLPDMRAQCARAGFIVDGRTLKRVAIAGGLTRALTIGRAIAAARTAGEDPALRCARALDGAVVYRGRLADKTWESRDGFMLGELRIVADQREDARIFLKNENHIIWIGDQPRYMAPDLICVVNAHTGEPYTNTNIEAGVDVAVIVGPAADSHRTPEAIEALGPRHYGFDIDYVPMGRAP